MGLVHIVYQQPVRVHVLCLQSMSAPLVCVFGEVLNLHTL